MKKYLIVFLILTTFALPSAALAAAPASSSSCWSLSISGTVGCALQLAILTPVAVITFFFLTLASILTWVSGIMLNAALYNGVVNFAGSIGGTYGIGVGWGVLRDVGNIVLIFGFVFIGVAMILGLENYGIKKSLPQLLLFAILLNFSLFISQAVIDTSNLFSVAIYSNINSGASAACSGITSQSDCWLNEGLAGAVGTATKIGTLYSPGTVLDFIKNPGTTATTLIMATIFLLITATVFFAAAIMLIIRIITLVFLMVLSPIGFAGMALPQLHGYAKKWWQMLLSQSFFVPVYLILTLVGLKVGEGVANLGVVAGQPPPTLIDAITKGDAGSASVFLTFAIIIGFMVAALMSAKELGAIGADYAIKTAGAASFGTSAFVARRTGGRAVNRYAKYLEKSKWARTSFFGNLALRGARGVASSSFDVRGSALGGNLIKSAGVDFGKAGGKGGYRQNEIDSEKSKVDYLKHLKMTPEEEAAEKAEQAKVETLKKQQKRALAPHADAVEDQRKQLAEARKRGNATEIAAEQDKLNKLRDVYDKEVDAQKKALTAQEDAAKDAKNVVGREYVKYLEGGVPTGFKTAYKLTAGPAGDKLAASKIKKDLKKTTEEKELDGIRALKDKAENPAKPEAEENVH